MSWVSSKERAHGAASPMMRGAAPPPGCEARRLGLVAGARERKTDGDLREASLQRDRARACPSGRIMCRMSLGAQRGLVAPLLNGCVHTVAGCN
jgi:hypothetical protein